MKKVIILTSFGTSERRGIENSIKAIQREVENAFQEYSVVIAFTSRHIREKLLLKYDLEIYSLEGALKRIYENGGEEVIILPLHLIKGKEHSNICEISEEYKEKFKKLKIVEPLLSLDQDGNLEKINEIIENLIKIKPKKEPILFLGHGIKNTKDLPFMILRKELRRRGITGIYFATLAGNPTFEEIVDELKKDGVKELNLTSFLIVDGYHGRVDIFGEDKNSWYSRLVDEGFLVKKEEMSLGERYEIRELYLKILIKFLD